MKVALLIVVSDWVTKSSAVSVSSLPGLATRERVAIRPSGLPVLKEKGMSDAVAGELATPHKKISTVSTQTCRQFVLLRHGLICELLRDSVVDVRRACVTPSSC